MQVVIPPQWLWRVPCLQPNNSPFRLSKAFLWEQSLRKMLGQQISSLIWLKQLEGLCRVLECMGECGKLVTEFSPRTQADMQFEISEKIYQKASKQTEDQRFMTKAKSLPSLSRHRRNSVKLACGLPANPYEVRKV